MSALSELKQVANQVGDHDWVVVKDKKAAAKSSQRLPPNRPRTCARGRFVSGSEPRGKRGGRGRQPSGTHAGGRSLAHAFGSMKITSKTPTEERINDILREGRPIETSTSIAYLGGDKQGKNGRKGDHSLRDALDNCVEQPAPLHMAAFLHTKGATWSEKENEAMLNDIVAQHMNVFVYHKDIAHVVTKATNATMAAQALAGMAGKRKVGGTCWEVAHLLQHGYTVETLLKNGGVHLVPPGSPTKEEHTSVLKSKGQ